jgi:hypothetical protein
MDHMMPSLQESTHLWLPWRISFAASNHCPCISQDFNLWNTSCKQGHVIRAASRVVSKYQLHGIRRLGSNSRPVVDCVKVELEDETTALKVKTSLFPISARM